MLKNIDKIFEFILLILLTVTTISVFLILIKSCLSFSYRLRINIIDCLILAWFVYVVINGIIHNITVSNRLIELFALILFYIILRQINPNKYIILIAAIIGSLLPAFDTLREILKKEEEFNESKTNKK